ncbi:MAG: hypothetical protein JXD22_07070 [Sedimentisphaerales bacterium]|nr:hypothetical protein [Sedimentisphaerales bacterium]
MAVQLDKQPLSLQVVLSVFRVEQAEQLKVFALAQQLRNILAMEQEHAMDLKQVLGK